MTPKEKAENIIDRFTFVSNEYKEHLSFDQVKECSVIVVDEIIEILYESSVDLKYWFEVKKEINNL